MFILISKRENPNFDPNTSPLRSIYSTDCDESLKIWSECYRVDASGKDVFERGIEERHVVLGGILEKNLDSILKIEPGLIFRVLKSGEYGLEKREPLFPPDLRIYFMKNILAREPYDHKGSLAEQRKYAFFHKPELNVIDVNKTAELNAIDAQKENQAPYEGLNYSK